jgi:hypothetical protein
MTLKIRACVRLLRRCTGKLAARVRVKVISIIYFLSKYTQRENRYYFNTYIHIYIHAECLLVPLAHLYPPMLSRELLYSNESPSSGASLGPISPTNQPGAHLREPQVRRKVCAQKWLFLQSRNGRYFVAAVEASFSSISEEVLILEEKVWFLSANLCLVASVQCIYQYSDTVVSLCFQAASTTAAVEIKQSIHGGLWVNATKNKLPALGVST